MYMADTGMSYNTRRGIYYNQRVTGSGAEAISQKGMEQWKNTKQLCKSLLQCLIFTKC